LRRARDRRRFWGRRVASDATRDSARQGF
jgi:hypothetical protein